MPKKKSKKGILRRKMKKKRLRAPNKKGRKTALKKIEKPSKHKAFLNYAFWRSLPFSLREMDLKHQKNYGFDAEDSSFKELLEIDTKGKFCKAFKVSYETLQVWDNSVALADQLEELNRNSIALQFRKDIDFEFTLMTLQESDARRVELWYQLFMGRIIPKKLELGGSVEAKMTFADFVKQVAKEEEE